MNDNNLPPQRAFNWNQTPKGIRIERQAKQLTLSSTFRASDQLSIGIPATIGVLAFAVYLFYTALLASERIEFAALFGGFFCLFIGFIFLLGALYQLFGSIRVQFDLEAQQLSIYSGWWQFSKTQVLPLDAITNIKETVTYTSDNNGNKIPRTQVLIQAQNGQEVPFGKQLSEEKRLYLKRALEQILADKAEGFNDDYLTDDLSQHLIE